MEERKGFGSNFGFLMAAVGSAVGLGNIWGFPNKMGACGGFTFLIIYLILAVCCGFIVMVGELALGRKTGKGAVGAYKALSKKFKWMGWMGILSAFFILFFYCALGGYCIKYTVLNIGDLFGASFGANAIAASTVDAASATVGDVVFNAFMSSPGEAVIYGLIFVALTMLIVLGGVGGGIEKVCSVGMPALFVALLICIIRACTLSGVDATVQVLQADGSLVEHVIHGSALDGLKYMFAPGWAAENGYYVPASAIIGGVKIPYEKGLLGHSDADVLLHAIMDALLGAAALGDIGKHFPDTDPAYKGISSIKLLEKVGELLEENHVFIENIDATIIAQAPKMRPHIPQMEENIAGALGISTDQVNVKATTEEGLGFTGTEEGISSQAICALSSFYEGSFTVADSAAGCAGCGGCGRSVQ